MVYTDIRPHGVTIVTISGLNGYKALCLAYSDIISLSSLSHAQRNAIVMMLTNIKTTFSLSHAFFT